jgi:hypothetical protein
MKFALKFLAALVVGTALGLLVTWLTIMRGMPDGISNGPWRTNLLIGSSGGDSYVRARVAVHGLLALNRSETIYFTATTDNSGQPLDGACTYQITGHDPDARWWSITAYGPDDFLIPNPVDSYSISKNSVVRQSDGSFTASVGSAATVQNWIPTARGQFSLTLRLYNPGNAVAANPAGATLPAIVRGACT